MPKILESYVIEEEVARDILTCKDRDDIEKLLCKYKEKSLNARMKCDPKFATSPILLVRLRFFPLRRGEVRNCHPVLL